MAGQANRRTEPGRTSTGTMALLVLLLFLFAVVGVLWAAVALGSPLSSVNPDLPADPFDLLDGLRRGTVVWPAAATWLTTLDGGSRSRLSTPVRSRTGFSVKPGGGWRRKRPPSILSLCSVGIGSSSTRVAALRPVAW